MREVKEVIKELDDTLEQLEQAKDDAEIERLQDRILELETERDFILM